MSNNVKNYIRTRSKETNYASGSVLGQDLSKWNDHTVTHEIELCREALYGDDTYGLSGLLREPPTDNVQSAIAVWSTRLTHALREAVRRKIISKKQYKNYTNELDFKLILQYEHDISNKGSN